MNPPPPNRIPAQEHGIDQSLLDINSLEVVSRLKEAGFDAFLVGGCVRDLLLGVTPKDFDVATSATPEEVKSLFRRARLVGRRFRIAHVRFGRDIIEVSTFRKSDPDTAEFNQHGMIVSDNEFGTLVEDAYRRDFTINALYYDPVTGDVLDYVGALRDMADRRIDCIGDAHVRLAEDPVRALRALRFKAKLNFSIADSISDMLEETAERLSAIPSARLFEEFNKLFMLGYAHPAWRAISTSPIHRVLFPCTPADSQITDLAMRNTDERLASGKPATPGFLIAVLLWEDYSARLRELSTHQPRLVAAHAAADQTLAAQSAIIAIPRRYSTFAQEVWQLQPRIEERAPRGIMRLLGHKRFRAAYDLLGLRAHVDTALKPVFDWWTQFQEEPEQRDNLLASVPKLATAKKPRRRRRNRNKPAQPVSDPTP